MTKDQIRAILIEAFKSINIYKISVDVDYPFINIFLVSDDFTGMIVPDRVELLTRLLDEGSREISSQYSVTLEPLTQSEFEEWFSEYDI